jgi:hypothetical protein
MDTLKNLLMAAIMDLDDILIEATECDGDVGETVPLVVVAQEKLEEALDQLPST